MLNKTHLAIGVFIGLYFVMHIKDQFLFMFVLLISTLLPNADKFLGFRNLPFLKKHSENNPLHRGVLHTYTFCIAISVLFAFFYPLLALPFFLGYSMHIFADSFTSNGVKPFWPLKYTSSGPIHTGGKREIVVFWVIILANVILFALLFF